jgi:peptidoglycan/xylan/chitin deacetylase (PgdA/CDA1 family)
MGLSTFEQQVDLLQSTHEIIPLGRVRTPSPPGVRHPRAAITFDDGYRGAVRLALPALARRGLPATMFIVAGKVAGTQFWWDDYKPAAGRRWAGLRRRALSELAGREDAIRAAAVRRLAITTRAACLPDSYTAAGTEELREALQGSYISVGSHSWSHPNLEAMADQELEEELTRSREWVLDRFDSAANWLAYPYGIFSPRVERAAQLAGYEGALSLGGQWVTPVSSGAFTLPRMNVPAALARSQLISRAAGVPL